MFVPLHDQNPLKYIRFPWATRGIVVLNVLIFLFYQRGGNAEVGPNCRCCTGKCCDAVAAGQH